MRPYYVIAIALLFLATLSPAQIAGYRNFEIVESAPLETNLDNPDIRNAFDVWMEMINGAKRSLDIEQFYIADQKGELLEKILAAIVDAGKRGVTVRLIIDARMYKTYPEPANSLGKNPNVSLRVIDFGKLTGGIQHAKFFIVDGEQIFLGSQNFDWRALNHIQELGVRIAHPEAVKIYSDLFELDWQLADKNDPASIASLLKPAAHTMPLTIVGGPGDTLKFLPTMTPKGLITDSLLWDETHIIRLIDEARQNVNVQVMTYSLRERGGSGQYTALDSALRRAAARGVKVRLLVADWSIGESNIGALKSLSSTPNIEVKYTAIPEHSSGYISFARVEHCKYLTADSGRAWIGTSNWEKSYFHTVRNLGVVIESPKINALLQDFYSRSWDGPYANPITPEGQYKARERGEKQ